MDLKELFQDLPTNWGRWGADDELGAVNLLDAAAVLRGIRAVRQGKVFTLGLPMNSPDGDLAHPVRRPILHFMTNDKGSYLAGRAQPAGGWEYADDAAIMYLQGSTQIDALGHVWYGDQLYNGYPAESTIGGLRHNAVVGVADHGIVGRAVLADVARFKRMDHLPEGYGITLDELLRTLEAQQSPLEAGDMLYVRTGFYRRFLEGGAPRYLGAGLNEPGLSYSPELVRWFQDNEIPVLASDTMGDEQTTSDLTGTFSPLHPALITRLGVSLTEMNWLEPLAEDCATDGQYTFLSIISPLKIHGAAGSPINPIAIK